MELNETPPEAARREALEETGLEITFIKQENIWIDEWNAKSFERPYLCLLENIPAFGQQAPHQHIDMIYLAKPSGGSLNTTENHPLQWFTMEEVENLATNVEIFEETKKAIRTFLTLTDCDE